MTGVIAQDVEKILPDAVSKSGPCTLSNGEEIDNVLIVDKDRIFLGNAPICISLEGHSQQKSRHFDVI